MMVPAILCLDRETGKGDLFIRQAVVNAQQGKVALQEHMENKH